MGKFPQGRRFHTYTRKLSYAAIEYRGSLVLRKLSIAAVEYRGSLVLQKLSIAKIELRGSWVSRKLSIAKIELRGSWVLRNLSITEVESHKNGCVNPSLVVAGAGRESGSQRDQLPVDWAGSSELGI